jgi:tRNA threonylcarbamoyladenosine biosynthesis protein TsaB
MKILAIETSTMLGGIALMDESMLIAESRLNVKSTHSERLMTEIEHCLKQSGVKISDIDVFAVATGPGSFTGLRIGLSTVKGFSYATGRPIVSVPTLEALAWNFPYSKYPVCTMLDARKKEVYAALFKWEEGNFIRLINETSAKPEEFACDALRITHDDKFIFAGEGAALYRDKIIEVMGEKAIFASPEKTVPSPANVAVLGLKKAKAGEFSEPVSLTPIYIRKSEAEVKWKDLQ